MHYKQYFVVNLIWDSHTLVRITFAFVQEKKRVCMRLGISLCTATFSVALFHLNFDVHLLFHFRHTVHKDLKYHSTVW